MVMRRRERVVRFLLYDSLEQSELTSDDGDLVHSPVQCLDKAMDRNPEIIIIRFEIMPLWKRKALVELCAVLKHNSHTQQIPVLALLPIKHRGLMEALARAGVNFIKIMGEITLNSTLICEILDALTPNDRVQRQLSVVCPYLHYDIIDVQHEVTVCGAYLNRMVLGDYRLHEVCETGNHLQCEYFLKPRLASARSVNLQD
jgi:hypothetical protein